MSDYRDESCIEHMVEACQKIGRLISVSQLALERLFELVGEAAAKVSEEFRSLHPFVPWRQAIAMRNFVIHDYAGVSPDIMWDTALTDIPKLLADLSEIKSK